MAKYNPDPRTAQQIAKAFRQHPMNDEQIARAEQIRRYARGLANEMAESCPPSRELSLALTKLEESTMHATSAIARNETEKEG